MFHTTELKEDTQKKIISCAQDNFMVALCNRADHYICALRFFFYLLSSIYLFFLA